MNSYSGKNILITGSLEFIGSNPSRALLFLGANVTPADSLIPKYGGNIFNIHDICDFRNSLAMDDLIQGKDYLSYLAGQTSHLDSMEDTENFIKTINSFQER